MRKRMFLAFFIMAFLFRLAVAAGSGMYHWMARSEVEIIAMNVAEFGDYNLYSSPTAHSTPVFPLLLAGIFSIFGTGVLAQAVNTVLACAVSAVRCGLVPLFAMDAGFDPKIGAIAGGLSVVYFGSLFTEISGKVEGPYSALALLFLIWMVMRMWRDGSWQTRTPWWFLGLCGFSALLNPSLIAVMVGLLVAGAVACPRNARPRYFRQAALVVGAIFAFLLPWAVRNYLSLGSPILTRSNFGLEFSVSNGPGKTYDLKNNDESLHPSGNEAEATKVADLGEVEYNRMKLAETMQWIRAHPGDFLLLTAERVAAWWFPPYPRLLMAPKIAISLAAFAGLWLMFRRQPLVACLFLITWITYPNIYYVIQWIGRYRCPMDWQVLVCASVALFAAWQAIRPRHEAARNVPAVA